MLKASEGLDCWGQVQTANSWAVCIIVIQHYCATALVAVFVSCYRMYNHWHSGLPDFIIIICAREIEYNDFESLLLCFIKGRLAYAFMYTLSSYNFIFIKNFVAQPFLRYNFTILCILTFDRNSSFTLILWTLQITLLVFLSNLFFANRNAYVHLITTSNILLTSL